MEGRSPPGVRRVDSLLGEWVAFQTGAAQTEALSKIPSEAWAIIHRVPNRLVPALLILVATLTILAPVEVFGALGDYIDVIVVTPTSCVFYRECEVLNEDGSVAGFIRFRFRQCG